MVIDYVGQNAKVMFSFWVFGIECKKEERGVIWDVGPACSNRLGWATTAPVGVCAGLLAAEKSPGWSKGKAG